MSPSSVAYFWFCDCVMVVDVKASIFSLVMVNYLEFFCKEQYIKVAFFFFGWLILWDGFVEVLLFWVVLLKVYDGLSFGMVL